MFIAETSALPLKYCTASSWSQWINNDSPDVDGVDRERMTEAELKSFCPNGYVTDVRCQTIEGLPSYTAGDVMTCTVQDGAVCKSEDNYPIDCQDYMVQYYCNCTGVWRLGIFFLSLVKVGFLFSKKICG